MTVVRLFGGDSIREVSAERMRRMHREIDAAGEELLTRDPAEVVQDLLSRYQITHAVPRPARKGKYLDEVDYVEDALGRHRIKTTKVQCVIEFDGDKSVWKWRPRVSTTEVVEGDLRDGHLTIVIRSTQGADALQAEFQRVVDLTQRMINSGAPEITAHNTAVEAAAKRSVQSRLEELKMTRSMYDALPYELHRRVDALPPEAPVKRRRIVTTPVADPRSSDEAQRLNDAIYDDVIGVIDRAARQMERSPATMRRIGEEMRRDLILIALNAVFEGGASGEAFSGSGRTDVLLSAGGGNVFVAECKIWSGQRSMARAVDQLLSYVTWRDTKAALIVFVGRLNASLVLERARSAIGEHSLCNLALEAADQSRRCDFEFRHPGDRARLLRLALLPVMVPDPAKSVPTP